ncbi:hypothetical protein SAMN04488029_4031 [Reichenbachiella faecimaris]|uniref:Secreted protein n=1 Tax=Reichenbachiella faecimaris TaxID=692418 RepID=A0A1W2GQZ9_REIFA|nr:hypothetical protein [Reichenbachiella faecimaris]SMD39077.1 hypothetical protein SAMN04488029_4031 [Reichenbachiella faecimaris]
MRKLVSLLLVVLFLSSIATSCVDAQADEVYDNVVPEKSQDGDATNHETSGPL